MKQPAGRRHLPPLARTAAPRRLAPPGKPERLRRVCSEINILPAGKPAIVQIDGDDPLQPPQPHLRQRVDMRNQPPASAIENPVGAKDACRRLLRVTAISFAAKNKIGLKQFPGRWVFPARLDRHDAISNIAKI
jgi:hypothetical protein